MDITVISSGTTKFTADFFTEPAVTKALNGGGSVASAILDTTDTILDTDDDEYAIVTGDDGEHLWSGPLSGQPGMVTIRPAVWMVSIWGGHMCPASAPYVLLVTDQGEGLYAIRSGWTFGQFVIDADGNQCHDDPGNPRLRFPLNQALSIAWMHAGTIHAGDPDWTAYDAYAQHQATGCPSA